MAIKIISWNLKNVSLTKLSNSLTGATAAGNLGNTICDYVVKVVTGDPAWSSVTTTNPADVFIIIELKTGGTAKGGSVSGKCTSTLAALVSAMNLSIGVRGLGSSYNYVFVKPEITGNHECVGVIYNKTALTLSSSGALKDNNNKWIRPRTPFHVQFTSVSNTSVIYNIIGIHAPPPIGGSNKYEQPIKYAVSICKIKEIINSAKETVLIAGDFNCNPSSTFSKQVIVNHSQKKKAIPAFDDLWNLGYKTILPAYPYPSSPPLNTYSSTRKKYVSSNTKPLNYLNEAFDNIIYDSQGNINSPVEKVLDTIGNATNASSNTLKIGKLNYAPNAPFYPNLVKQILNNYNKVSDHLPITIEF